MNSGITTLERRKYILNEITQQGQVLIHELSKRFIVSEVTIRNDLEQLERKKMLLRVRGGAIKYEGNVAVEQGLSEKSRLNHEEKARIGKKAAEMIKNGETIILDSGTTTMEIAKHLPSLTNITVITNALNIVNQLVNQPGVNVMMPGGNLQRSSLSLIGSLAEKNLRNFFVDKMFLGVDGFDTRHGVYTPNLEEAHLNEIMIQNSKEVILVTDSSKFERRSLAFICGIECIHIVVTDDGISDDDRRRLEDAGVRLIIA
jgi:DeoR family transcriptional regulator, aga operon transcriptional repressor